MPLRRSIRPISRRPQSMRGPWGDSVEKASRATPPPLAPGAADAGLRMLGEGTTGERQQPCCFRHVPSWLTSVAIWLEASASHMDAQAAAPASLWWRQVVTHLKTIGQPVV